MFKQAGFRITIDIGLTTTNILEITLDLKNDIFKSFINPNANIRNINMNSNHPWHIKKTIPNMINNLQPGEIRHCSC